MSEPVTETIGRLRNERNFWRAAAEAAKAYLEEMQEGGRIGASDMGRLLFILSSYGLSKEAETEDPICWE